ncbi:MAG: branched-chain amino acid ABC transporter permease [Microthrixaceae bacterium]|nr:branched-chain amino acid ABC transporter permease [Microthrixaceae bacterium]
MSASDPLSGSTDPKSAGASPGSLPAPDADALAASGRLDALLAPDRKAQLIKGVIALVLAIVVLSLPFQYADFQLDRFSKVIAYAIAAMGLNLLTGFTGQVSVGHAAFFGVGAYTSAILVNDHGWPLLGSVVVAGLIAMAVGVVVGLPALRIRGLYLALVTLSLAMLFPQVVKRFDWLTGGSEGKPLRTEVDLGGGVIKPRTVRFDPPFGDLTSSQWTYYVFLAIGALFFLVAWNLIRSRMGRAMVAVRDNEIAATSSGINLARVKVSAFGLSAMYAGVGGALYALNEGNIVPDKFGVEDSIYLLVAVVVGGAASLWGPAIGAVAIVFLADLVPEDLQPASRLIQGVLLIALIIAAPGGLTGLIKRGQATVTRRLRSRSASQDTATAPDTRQSPPDSNEPSRTQEETP